MLLSNLKDFIKVAVPGIICHLGYTFVVVIATCTVKNMFLVAVLSEVGVGDGK